MSFLMELWFKLVKNQQTGENLEFVFRFSWKHVVKACMDFISYLMENDFLVTLQFSHASLVRADAGVILC